MTKRIALRDTELFVVDEGTGPPLLLIHGFPLDHTMWRHQIAHFSTAYRVIAPDLRGFGQSTVTPGTVSMHDFASDLAQLLVELEESRLVTVCGLSMGGYIAMQFAFQFSTQLAALILCDTKAAPDSREAAQTRLDSAEKLEQEGTSFLANTMLPKLFGNMSGARPVPYIKETADVIMRTDPRGAAAAQRGMAERDDSRPRLAAIRVPTLVLSGERDLLTPPREMRELATAIPNARFVEIAGANHMAPFERPELVNAAIAEFLRGL